MNMDGQNKYLREKGKSRVVRIDMRNTRWNRDLNLNYANHDGSSKAD